MVIQISRCSICQFLLMGCFLQSTYAQEPLGGGRARTAVLPGTVLPGSVLPGSRRAPDGSSLVAQRAAGGQRNQADEIDDELTAEERANIAVYEKCNRSVVNITTKGTRSELFFLEAETEGAGSGSILDKQGHVLTNFHVIEGAQRARVTLYTGTSYEATLVGHDAPNDIAVLRVAAPAEELFPIEFGDSSRLKVGQRIYAIGNPFGLDRTMTIGIISSLNRSLGRSFRSMIQVDAALNRGNSGGPLLNSRGRLVGMNTAIASSTGENTGVGFAIPANTLARVVPQLIENRRVVRPDIGISRVQETENGILIMKTVKGGPADRAGLQGLQEVVTQKRRGPFVYEERRWDASRADRILAVDGVRVRTADDVLGIVETKRPGEVVVLTVEREDRARGVEERVVEVVLGAADP